MFRGSIPALVTPFKDGALDLETLDRMIEWHLAEGSNGFVPVGTTGESPTLSHAEHGQVVERVVKAAAGRVPVIAGVAAASVHEAVAQARRAAALGADGIMAVLDAYFPLGQDAVQDYFRAVADATDRPLTIYTNPNFQRADLSVETVVALSDHPNILYLKDASTNTGRLLSILNRVEGRLGVFAASSHITVAVMMIGGLGWMAGPSCLIPRQSVDLYELCRAREWDAAMALQRRLWHLNEAFARFNLAGAIKAGLRVQGHECGDPIPPQPTLKLAEEEEIRAVLAGLGAL